MDLLFSHVTAVTMDPARAVLPDAFVGVEDGKIAYLSKKPPEGKPKKIIEATGMVMLPGLINCHAHLGNTVLRGWGDEVDERTRLSERLYPREEQMDEAAIRASALLAIAESLRAGVTSISCLETDLEAVAGAAAESGIKANVAPAMSMYLGDDFDFETYPDCQALVRAVERYHGYDHGRIRIDAGLHGVYSSTYQLWEALSEYAINAHLGLQLHLAETETENEDALERAGLPPAALLDCHGLLSLPIQAAGCGCLADEDMALLARRKATAVHCPLCEEKLGKPSANPAALAKAGLNVALGTGSAAEAGSLDLFRVMRAACLQSKAKAGDPTALSAEAALLMATVCGAKAQGRAAECGMLKLGMDADLVLLDFTQPHLIPCHNVYSNLVYSASGADVAMTLVRGQILYAAGEFPTIDLAKVIETLSQAMPRIFADNKEESSQDEGT